MSGRMLLLFLMVVLASRGSRAGESDWRVREADSLYRSAVARLAGGGRAEDRVTAMRELDRAMRLDASRPEPARELAALCIAAGQFQRSRECLERIERIAPEDAGSRLALGRSWRWDWLTSHDPASYASATRCYLEAARLAPEALEPRVALAALGLATGDAALASRAAESAIRAAPDSADALLALACIAYRAGNLPRAERAFREGIARLDPVRRGRFAAPEAFWHGRDPDLTTPENEIELDHLSRVAQALLLSRDERGLHRWDVRADLFVRYGLPSEVEVNPEEMSLGEHRNLEMTYRRLAHVWYAPDPIPYPYALQVWSYPELGIRAELWDLSLRQDYQLSVAYEIDPEPRARLASGPDLEVMADGKAVYRKLPPGLRRLPARGAVVRFPSRTGGRLLALVEAPAGGADTLQGAWVVVALAGGRIAASGTTRLAVSTCAPGERQVAAFSADVPPGEYRVDIAVDDGHGARGVVRSSAVVESPPPDLAISDLVLLCGRAPARGDAVWIEPDLDRRVVARRSLALYFEIDGLAEDTSGVSRFAYRYVVRRMAEKGRRKPSDPILEASREEENVGPLRRQYLDVPLEGVGNGLHEIEVEIVDRVSGATARAACTFRKE